MAGLVPAIHVLPTTAKNVDARDKPGHDDLIAPNAHEFLPTVQSQFLNFQGFIFHGVSVSIRHWVQRSGGQWLRREASLTGAGSSTRGIARRRFWRVMSLIISTNSGLSATAGSPCERIDCRKETVCSLAA